MSSLAELVASANLLDHAAIAAYCRAEGITVDECYNHISLHVAQRFDEGSMSFAEADLAMNTIFGLMINDVCEHNRDLAQPAYAIYEAFDAGEYDHGDGADPVENIPGRL
ncbi:MAG: hypothetical protein ABJ308_05925 [Halieaceae bacterium]